MRRWAVVPLLLACALVGAWSTRSAPVAPAAARASRPVVLAQASVAPRPVAPRGPAGHVPRVLMPDAERAGQVAGQIAEARWRVARAGGACDDAELAVAAEVFAEARTHADDADWQALAATLDAVLDALARCPSPGVGPVRARLRGWRSLPPFPR